MDQTDEQTMNEIIGSPVLGQMLERLYYVLDGTTPRAIDDTNLDELLAWAQWMQKRDRFLARDDLADGTVISTSFIGTDMSVLHLGAPMLFETMVLDDPVNDPGALGAKKQAQWRYATWEQAMEGHARVVATYSATQEER